MSVEVSGLTKSFGDIGALREVSFEVGDGEFVVVVGPSGSGKSTLLRCIAGLEHPEAGSISVAGRDVTAALPGARDIAMVFQDYALYPHLDARTNIAFPLLARKVPQAEIAERVQRAADMLGLGETLDRRPGELSGGERRRVALARAVVREPRAFLMDEPLASLDVALKRRVQVEIRELQRQTGTSTLYVTHDQVEAMMLAHRLVVLRAGRIEQIGRPKEIYDRPSNTFVASFLGRTPMNLVPGSVLGVDAHTAGLRPEHISISDDARLRGTVRVVDDLGSERVLEVSLDEHRLLVQVASDRPFSPGDQIGLGFEERRVHRFDAQGAAVER